MIALSVAELNKPADVFLHFLKKYPEDFTVSKAQPNPVYESMSIVHRTRGVCVTIRSGYTDNKQIFAVIEGDDHSRKITTASEGTSQYLWETGLKILKQKEILKGHSLNVEASKILMDTYGETF